MAFLTYSSEVLAELASIPDPDPDVSALFMPRVRDFQDEGEWFKAFDKWTASKKGPVDSLHPDELKEVIEAVSHTDVTKTMEDSQSILKSSVVDEDALWQLEHTTLLLEAECVTIQNHLNRYIGEWAVDSPFLIDEYALLNQTARRTTEIESMVASIMTWYNWPTGFNHLLRVLYVHTRSLEDLFRFRELLMAKPPRSQSIRLTTQRLHPEPRPYNYGYEHFPTVDGFADFRPPRSSLNSREALDYFKASMSIRTTRRQTAMARFAEDGAGVSDFHIPKHAEMWWNSARAWLDATLPRLPIKQVPQFASLSKDLDECANLSAERALEWRSISKNLDGCRERWRAEAEYENKQVLRNRDASYRLTYRFKDDLCVVGESKNGAPLPAHVSRRFQLSGVNLR